jgi:hypothetical protein
VSNARVLTTQLPEKEGEENKKREYRTSETMKAAHESTLKIQQVSDFLQVN